VADGGEASEIDSKFGGARHLLDAQIQEIPIAPAAGKIGAGLLRQNG
jgi:hypothetical protein